MTTTRSLRTISLEISADWEPRGKGVYFGAKPYLLAMATMDEIGEAYGLDPGFHIVNYFLANANAWRGETARRVKLELKAMVKAR